MREYHVRICERLGVKFPGPTRQNEPCHSLRRHGRSTSVSGPAGPGVGASGSGQHPCMVCSDLLDRHLDGTGKRRRGDSHRKSISRGSEPPRQVPSLAIETDCTELEACLHIHLMEHGAPCCDPLRRVGLRARKSTPERPARPSINSLPPPLRFAPRALCISIR